MSSPTAPTESADRFSTAPSPTPAASPKSAPPASAKALAAGDLSPARFVTDYQKLSAAAKYTIFTAEQRARLNEALTVSNQIKDKIDKFTNTGKTGSTLTHVGDAASILNPVLSPKLLAAIGSARGVAGYVASPVRMPLLVMRRVNTPTVRGLLAAYNWSAVGGLLAP